MALKVTRGWEVLQPMTLAILDRRFALAVSQSPEVVDAVMNRLAIRLRGLSFHLAVCQMRRVDTRVLVMLWYFAERWGRVTPEGVLVPVPMTHELLSHCVGAHRPSVSSAVSRLTTMGLVGHQPRGGWILHGDPPRTLADAEEQIAEGAEALGAAS